MIACDFKYIEGQKALSVLDVLIKKQILPHAFLFTGVTGVGKRQAALAIAMKCNCRKIPASSDYGLSAGGLSFLAECGCAPCAKIRSGNHPDIHWVAPEGNAIKIHQIRSLIDALAMKPFEARLRIAVILQADAMNPEAANALLKMLEEPSGQTVLILTATEPEGLLPTVASRCRTIRFRPASEEQVMAYLRSEKGVCETDAAVLARMSGGSYDLPMAAPEMMKAVLWITRVMERLTHPGGSRPGPAFLLAVAEKLAARKENLRFLLDLMAAWLRDAIIYSFTPDRIGFQMAAHHFRRISQRMSGDMLLKKIEHIQTAHRQLRVNANTRLTLEVMLLRLACSP